MAQKINCHHSYDIGKTAARKEAITKQIELQFDAMKQHYVDMLNDIYNDEIIDEMFDSSTFFTNDRSRQNLEFVMNSVKGGVVDYKAKKVEKQNKKATD